MDISDIKVTSFMPDGMVRLVDLTTNWGSELLETLRNNITIDEEILFAILTIRSDNITNVEAVNWNGHNCFFCLVLVPERLIVCRVLFHDFFRARNWQVMIDAEVLSSIESLLYKTYDVQYGRICEYSVKSNAHEIGLSFGYREKYHQYLKPYIDQIEQLAKSKRIINCNVDLITELERLARLKERGLLSNDEFILAKKCLLERGK